MGIGDWGLGFWVWGVLGGGEEPKNQKQKQKPQKFIFLKNIKIFFFFLIYIIFLI